MGEYSIVLRPTGDSSTYDNYSPYPASPTTKYDKVDEVTADEDATYIYHNVTGQAQMFTFETLTLPTRATITKVIVKARAKRIDSGAQFDFEVYNGASSQSISSVPITPDTTYTNYESDEQTTDPFGGSWTEDNINSYEWGVLCQANYNHRITQLWVEVWYEYKFIVGRKDITDSASILDTSKTGNNRMFRINVFGTNAGSIETDLNTQANFAGRIEKIIVPYGENKYNDISPYGENLIYVKNREFEGWFLQDGYTPRRRAGFPNYYEIIYDLIEIDNLMNYRMMREAEDINVTGTATADVTCSNQEKVVYTCTSGTVDVLDSDELNLQDGDYKVEMRTKSDTTNTAVFIANVGPTSGSDISSSTPDTWEMLNLGTFTVSDLEDDVVVSVNDPSNTNNVELDCITLKRVV